MKNWFRYGHVQCKSSGLTKKFPQPKDELHVRKVVCVGVCT